MAAGIFCPEREEPAGRRQAPGCLAAPAAGRARPTRREYPATEAWPYYGNQQAQNASLYPVGTPFLHQPWAKPRRMRQNRTITQSFPLGSSLLLRRSEKELDFGRPCTTKIPEPGRSPGFFAPEKNASFRKDLAKPAKGARGGEPPVWPGLGLFFLSVLRFCEGRPSHDPTD